MALEEIRLLCFACGWGHKHSLQCITQLFTMYRASGETPQSFTVAFTVSVSKLPVGSFLRIKKKKYFKIHNV